MKNIKELRKNEAAYARFFDSLEKHDWMKLFDLEISGYFDHNILFKNSHLA